MLNTALNTRASDSQRHWKKGAALGKNHGRRQREGRQYGPQLLRPGSVREDAGDPAAGLGRGVEHKAAEVAERAVEQDGRRLAERDEALRRKAMA